MSLKKHSSNTNVESKIDAIEDKVTLLRKGCKTFVFSVQLLPCSCFSYPCTFLIVEVEELKLSFISMEKLVKQLDQKLSVSSAKPTDSCPKPSSQPAKNKDDDDDDVDLFGSDSEVRDGIGNSFLLTLVLSFDLPGYSMYSCSPP